MTKPIVTAVLVLVAGVAAITAAGISAFDLDDRHQCEDAERLADVGFFEQARKKYAALLEEDPERACAQRGYVDVSARECRVAGVQLRAGDVAKAEAIYERLAAEPKSLRPSLHQCNPRSGLRKAVHRACTNIEPLLELGRVADAQTRFTKLLEKHPRAQCAVDGLRRVAELRCTAAAKLAAAGLRAEAKAAYGKVLESDAVAECAIQGLAGLAQP